MEVLDVPAVASLCLCLVANLLPDALTDLVARSLPWPTEVAVHLEVDELSRHVYVFAHEGNRIVEVPLAGAVESRLAKVNG